MTLAKLPTPGSSDSDLVLGEGYVYVVSKDNTQVYKVSMRRKNRVMTSALTDSSIQQVGELHELACNYPIY